MKPISKRFSDRLRSWSVEHPKVWLSVKAVQEKIIKYSQFHIDRAYSDELAKSGLPMAEYDGGAEMWANSKEELMSVCNIISGHDDLLIPEGLGLFG